MLIDWEYKLAIDYYDKYGDPIPVEELPGYVGNMWDGHVMLDASLGKLADLDWSEYGMLADELGEAERKLSIHIDGKVLNIEGEAWYPQVFIDQVPSVNAIYDEPPDQGPAAGSGYIFIAEDGFSDDQIVAHSNALFEALDYHLKRIREAITIQSEQD